MNDLPDKPLHDWVRQSLNDYEPAADPHEPVEDWQLLRPRLFPPRRQPVLWFWILGLAGLLGGLSWYTLHNERAKTASIDPKTLIPTVDQPVAEARPMPGTRIMLPEKTPAPNLVAPHRPTAKTVRLGTWLPPVRLAAVAPALPEKAEATASTQLKPLAGVELVKTPERTWPAVANRTLSPPEQALEDKLLSGEIGTDSTVFAALSRNLRQWPNAVIVCDLTTSMDPYAAQIYAWFRRNAKNPNVNGVVFFTDCDSLGQQTRPNGPPGAFFVTRERDPRAALPTLLAAARNTQNNRDGDENVVEALRYAQQTFPKSKHLILLADNGSGVKDMSLLVTLTKPVHVIACGEPLNNTSAFQDDQYRIAQKTGGSVHTLEDDFSPGQVTRSTFIRVGTYYYRYSPHKNRFVRTRFQRKPIRVLGVRL